MSFYEKYQILCRNVGKSTSAVANAIGLNNSSVTCWKRGSKPKAETIKKLSEYFGVAVDYLMGLTDDPRPAHPTGEPHTDSPGDELPPSEEKTAPKTLDRNLLLYFGDFFRVRQISVGEGDRIVVTYDFMNRGLNVVEFHKLLNVLLKMSEQYDFTVNDIFEIVRLTDKTVSNAARYLKVVQGDKSTLNTISSALRSEIKEEGE